MRFLFIIRKKMEKSSYTPIQITTKLIDYVNKAIYIDKDAFSTHI
jgi:hypothetical protein